MGWRASRGLPSPVGIPSSHAGLLTAGTSCFPAMRQPCPGLLATGRYAGRRRGGRRRRPAATISPVPSASSIASPGTGHRWWILLLIGAIRFIPNLVFERLMNANEPSFSPDGRRLASPIASRVGLKLSALSLPGGPWWSQTGYNPVWSAHTRIVLPGRTRFHITVAACAASGDSLARPSRRGARRVDSST